MVLNSLVSTEQLCSERGEGSARDMTGRGAHHWWAKTHVQEPRKVFEPNQTSFSKSNIQKRSYRRALNRIKKHGYTWYKGRIISGISHADNPPEHSLPDTDNSFPTGSQRRRRITCFSWNCGGMSQSNWLHFQQWLAHQMIDVITLQESHWPYCREWVQQHYFCIHSGQNGQQAGLITMISRKLCHQNAISWHETHPGRILHTRIHGQNRHIDIVNVYQHVHHPRRMEDRLQIWDALHGLISTLSKRNTWIMAGDFNTSLPTSNTAVGLPTYLVDAQKLRGPAHSDSNHLLNLLQIHHLAAINTWKHQLGPTYRFQNQHSRIDFFCIQQHMIDNGARDVHYLYDFPLLGLTGAKHYPMLCSIRKVWIPDRPEHSSGWSRAQRKELYLHWQQQDLTAIALSDHLQQQVDALPDTGDDRLHAVHACLNQVDASKYKNIQAERFPSFDLGPFKLFQHHTQCLRNMQGDTSEPHLLFQAWRHVCCRLRARRQMNANSKAAHKLRLMTIYDSASKAATAKDHFSFYQSIRELAPKQPFQRIQLRSPEGAILGPEASADLLQQWFTQLYEAPEYHWKHEPFDRPFSEAEMNTALQQLPAFKALASSSAWTTATWALYQFAGVKEN